MQKTTETRGDMSNAQLNQNMINYVDITKLNLTEENTDRCKNTGERSLHDTLQLYKSWSITTVDIMEIQLYVIQ
jgi:hypothetical protein